MLNIKKIEVMFGFVKGIWNFIVRMNEARNENRRNRLEMENLETYNKEALKEITAVPDGKGTYIVVLSGYQVSESLDAVSALKLVDVIRDKYVKNKLREVKMIFYSK